MRFKNNVQNVAGPADATEAAEAATCRIHHELLYCETQIIIEVTDSVLRLSYATEYVVCLCVAHSSINNARANANISPN